jgi:hypothetical protein
MAKLQLTHYKRKSIFAYVSKLELTTNGADIKRGPFINGQPIESDKERFYKGQSATVEIDLDKLEDGIYEYKEASGHKSSFGYIEVKGGEVVKDIDSKEDVLEMLFPLPTLPMLDGSDKQVDWANKIRAQALRWLWHQGFHGVSESYAEYCQKLPTDAKWWIDNGKDHGAHEAVRMFLGLEYNTPAGSDY